MNANEKVKSLIEDLLKSRIRSFNNYEYLSNKEFYQQTYRGNDVLFYEGGTYEAPKREIEVILNALKTENYLEYHSYEPNPSWSGLYCTLENVDGIDMFNVISIERPEFEMNKNLAIDLNNYPIIQTILDDNTHSIHCEKGVLLTKRLLLSIAKTEIEYRIFSYKDKQIQHLSQPIIYDKNWINSFQLYVQPLRLVFPRDERRDIRVVTSEIHGYFIVYMDRRGDLYSIPLLSFEKAELRKLELEYTTENNYDSIKAPDELNKGHLSKKGLFYYLFESYIKRTHGSNNWESEQFIYAEYDFKNMQTVIIKSDYNQRKL